MYKKLLIAMASLLLLGGARAQNATADSTITGANGSKAVILSSLRDGEFNFLSGKRYLSGSVGSAQGFVYDLQEGKTQLFKDYLLYAYFSPDHYVASAPGENQSIYFHYDGVDHELEPTVSGYGTYYDNISFWNAQPDGENVVALGYEAQIAPNDVTGKIDTVLNNVGVLYNGKTGKVRTLLHSYWPRVMPLRSELNIGYGSRAHAISADGLVLGGWGTHPIEGIWSVWSTVFWDLVDFETKDTVYTYGIEDPRFCLSDLVGANSDGSVLVGYNEVTTHGLIVHYDRAHKSFTLDTILPLPGWDFLAFNAVTDDGLVLGRCGIDANPSMSQAIVYTEKTGLMTLESYLYEYYDLAAQDLFLPTHMSADGSIMAGLCYDRGYTVPWFVQLQGAPILPRARTVKARAAASGLTVRLDWEKPVYSANTLTGYEIYRDNETEPIASVDADVLTYTDNTLASAGQHTYQVVAVYNEGKAGKTASNAVMTILEGGYFPVQQIDHRVQYNRYASIFWGLPSSEIVAAAAAPIEKGAKAQIDLAPGAQVRPRTATTATPARRNDAKAYLNPALDYISNVNMLTYSGYCGIQIGERYYVTSWQQAPIRVMDLNNNILEELEPAGMNHTTLSMVYLKDKNQLLCGGLEQVSILDLNNHTLRNQFEAEARHMSYLPDFEFGGETGVLLMGGWNTAMFYSLDGKLLGDAGFDFDDLDVSGTAYYDGKLYVASQTGPYLNEIYTFDIKTRQPIGEPVQVVEDPAVYDLLSLNGEVTSTDDLAYAAGLTLFTLDDGTVVLGATYQCSYTYSRFMLLELESAPERRGYTLLRNGEVIAEGLRTRRFYDELNAGGEYNYTVIAVAADKQSDPSPATTIRIADQGTCLPAKNIEARETNRWVALEWDVPTSDTAAGLIGFTVFRDGEQLKQLWNTEAAVEYTDFSTLELGKPYTYSIEALFGGGCVASDSVQITLTDEGEAMPPFGIRFDYKKNANATADNKIYDVTTKWETPMFEQPLAIGYGTGQMMTGGSFNEEIKEYWAAIGWDSIDLKMYKDLYLVGMEYFLGDNVRSFEAVVIMNNELTYTEPLRRTQAQAWQTMMFKQSIPMNQPVEAVLGYHVTYSSDATPIAIDFSYNKPFYSDLVSFDGQGWYSLAANKLEASWCIRGLVVRKRDLDEATTNGVVDFSKLEGKVIRMEKGKMPASLHLNAAAKGMVAKAPAKAPWSLQGFNIYRQRMDIDNQQEVQLNDSPLKTFSYTEAEPLPEGDYDYTVEAVYSNATKSATASVTLTDVSTETGLDKLTLTLYPNPASDVVYVNGAFSQLQILDLGGRVLRSLGSASQIEVGHLTPGTYFFRFADQDGRKATYKVVIR